MKQIIQNSSMFDYVVEQVSMVQNVIEDIIKPKVIVVKNKAVWAFWGKIPEYTWMGYAFKHIDNLDCGELCQITGFENKKDRINSNRTQTALKGSYIIFTTHTAVESYPSPEYLQTLLPQADY